MMLLRASGSSDRLNDFIIRLFGADDFCPEDALSFLSSSMGYVALNEASPFEFTLRDIEDTASVAGVTLDESRLSNVLGTDRTPDKNYMTRLKEYSNMSDKLITNVNGLLADIKTDIIAHNENRKKTIALIDSLKSKQENLSHFMKLDVDIDELLSASYLTVRFGSLPKDAYKQLKIIEEDGKFIFTPCSSDDHTIWGVYCAPKKYEKKVDEIFASLYFEKLTIDIDDGTAAEIIKKNADKIEELSEQLDVEDGIIKRTWDENSETILNTYSLLLDLQEIYKLRKYAAVNGESFYYVGWIPKSETNKDKTVFSDLDDVEITFEPYNVSDKKHAPPTKLKNNVLVRPYEYYVKMYGMPQYGSVDITSFVAVTYTLIFGMMFGDLGHGLVLLIIGALVWKLKKMELGKILIPCGISSMVFGLIFGSFFGYEEALDPLYHAVGLKQKPLAVMENITTVLIFAIGIGVALVIASMVINVIVNLKAHKFGAALFDTNGVTGIIFYTCLVNFILEFMAKITVIPNNIAIVLTAVCAVILYMKEIIIGLVDRDPNWKPDSMGDFLIQNVFELIEYVLSYFSNTVSFLRIGAFVLVHAGMMMVVFALGSQGKNIPVVILGNVLVIALEGLLTGIQALRLEFYEMFSRCFEGNGKPFLSVSSILKESKN